MQKVVDHNSSRPNRIETSQQERPLARRELLKLAPLSALGAFAVPGLQRSLLDRGREFTSQIQSALGSTRPAPTFSEIDLAPLRQFPVNAYLTDNPGIDPDEWRLKISGAVARPCEYTLADLRALPSVTQITRHICIEG